jgi:plastocyanin domain-containing protein
MSGIQFIVNILGLAAIAWIVWYFWLHQKEGIQVEETEGVQEVAVTVKGGYNPDVIVVKKGELVRLHFLRQESSLCSEMVVFDKLGIFTQLPEGEQVVVEFTDGHAERQTGSQVDSSSRPSVNLRVSTLVVISFTVLPWMEDQA